ncbi:histidinol-phosphatase [Ramicandelaber brevisporus]|nr:histidinol-phosphatase [Ramicandelaber brevisporus]
MPFTFHSHSGQFCEHAYGTLEDVVASAKRLGFRVLGLSEHVPRSHPEHLYPEEQHLTPADLHVRFRDYYALARQLQSEHKADTFEIIVGAETEFIEVSGNGRAVKAAEELKKLVDECPVDYLVGSVHHVHGIPIDFNKDMYQQAIAVSARNPDGHLQQLIWLFEDYFDAQYTMIQSIKPDIIGHFDLVRIFAPSPQQALQAVESRPVWQRVCRNIELAIKQGALFELNSRAWKKNLPAAYPHQEVVKEIQRQGGKFTISDDSHGPNDLGMHYDKLHKYLEDMGIDTVHILERLETGQSTGANTATGVMPKRVRTKAINNIIGDPFWQHFH